MLTLSEELLSPSPGIAEDTWEAACRQLLDAVPQEYLSLISLLLKERNGGGCGLRDWISAVAFRGAKFPHSIPPQIVRIYLNDPEAVPLHDCEECGLAVPVRPNRVHGLESDPECEYFPTCPLCGGRTGPFYYWSEFRTQLQRRKPR
ncbi:MAG: hypothetical protein SFX18_19985 [Pirellulales bacterium]|nr:hypothetical protein [Pirellulales bacterium]